MPLACFWNCAADSESEAIETTLVSAPAELRHNRPQLLSGRGESAAALAQILRGPMRPLRLGVAHRDSDTAIHVLGTLSTLRYRDYRVPIGSQSHYHVPHFLVPSLPFSADVRFG